MNSIHNQFVLIIDDDTRMLRALEKVLTSEGATVICAKGLGDAADTLAVTLPPEVPYTPLMEIPYYASCYTNTPTTQFYVVGPKDQLADGVVSLEAANGKDIIATGD